MAAQPVRKRATYADVLAAAPHLTAEVLDGDLYTRPRPPRAHLRSATGLGAFLFGAFQVGTHGTTGWTILRAPELHLGFEPDILVPDIAGWRAGRLVDAEDVDEPYITVVPDWVCEIASPGTRRIDRMKKMPICAREKVPHVWLVEPHERTVEVYRFSETNYLLIGTYGGDDPVRAEPFEAAEIPVAFLWGKDAARTI
jgi:Uma2 family endonuclease